MQTELRKKMQKRLKGVKRGIVENERNHGTTTSRRRLREARAHVSCLNLYPYLSTPGMLDCEGATSTEKSISVFTLAFSSAPPEPPPATDERLPLSASAPQRWVLMKVYCSGSSISAASAKQAGRLMNCLLISVKFTNWNCGDKEDGEWADEKRNVLRSQKWLGQGRMRKNCNCGG